MPTTGAKARFSSATTSSARFRTLAGVFAAGAMLATVLVVPAGAQAGATCDGVTATIVGTNGADVLVGTDGPDVIAGLGGNDRIDGLDGDDVICGDDGNDTIRAGRGEDTILGGGGNDIIRGQQSADVIDGGDGNDIIRGNNGADMIWGRAGNDTLLGGKGQDVVRGGAGADEIGGGNHDDTVLGGADDDILRGGNGADVVDGGAGVDDMRGGIGVDQIFTGGTVGDTINTGDGADFIDGVPEGELPPPPPPPPAAAGSFQYTDFGGETWSGDVFGLVDVGFNRLGGDEPGTCYLVVGEITPGVVLGPVSDEFSTPGVSVIAGGELFDFSGDCESGLAEDLGYSWILNAEAVSGTTIPFYQQVFIPEGQGPVTSIVVGNQFRPDELTVISPTILDSVPVPSGLAVGALPTGPQVGVDSTFTHTELSGETSWVGEVSAVVEVQRDTFVDESGRCFLVLGSLTPTEVEGLTTTGFDTPRIGLLVDGQYQSTGAGCDTTEVEQQGFDWIFDAEVTVGTEYLFYAEFFIPDAFTGDPTHVIVGRESTDADVFVN